MTRTNRRAHAPTPANKSLLHLLHRQLDQFRQQRLLDAPSTVNLAMKRRNNVQEREAEKKERAWANERIAHILYFFLSLSHHLVPLERSFRLRRLRLSWASLKLFSFYCVLVHVALICRVESTDPSRKAKRRSTQRPSWPKASSAISPFYFLIIHRWWFPPALLPQSGHSLASSQFQEMRLGTEYSGVNGQFLKLIGSSLFVK